MALFYPLLRLKQRQSRCEAARDGIVKGLHIFEQLCRRTFYVYLTNVEVMTRMYINVYLILYTFV